MKTLSAIHKPHWRTVSFGLIAYLVLLSAGTIISSRNGNVRHGNVDHKLLALGGVIVFIIFAVAFIHLLTNTISKSIVYHRLGVGRAAQLRFIIRLFGYLTIFFVSLDHIGVPVEHILLGSAVLGIILGVAAQQSLANFFASIVLIVSHPFSVGDDITIVSGGLGGKYVGHIADIGLTHTHLREKNGTIVALPNSTLLTGATIKLHSQHS